MPDTPPATTPGTSPGTPTGGQAPESGKRGQEWRDRRAGWARARRETVAGRAPASFTLALGILIGMLIAAAAARPGEQVVVAGGPGTAQAGEFGEFDGEGFDTQAHDGEDDAAGPAGPGARDDSPRPPNEVAPGAPQGTAGTAGAGAPAPQRPRGDPGPGEGPGEDPSGDPGGTPTGPPARGVSDDQVKIGVAVLDIGALRHLSPDFEIGDQEVQMRAWLEGVRADGLLPIHGRDLEFFYRQHQPTALNAASQRASCVGFVQDDEVFAVLGAQQYPVGAECVSREARTPIVAVEGVLEEVYERGRPFLYTVNLSYTRLMRNWVHWLNAQGLLEGRTIGVYYAGSGSDGQEMSRLLETAVKPTLAEFGQQVAIEHTTDQPLGGPQDAVAVRRFQTAGVDLAVVWTSKTGFMQQADVQQYRPTYVESDYKFGTADATASNHSPSQFDGTRAMSAALSGELNSGGRHSDLALTCERYYREHTGAAPDRDTTEWGTMVGMCDLGWILLDALHKAGPQLTHQTFVQQGIHGIENLRLGGSLPVTFGPGDFDGPTRQRTVQWHADCTCWKVAGEWGGLWVR